VTDAAIPDLATLKTGDKRSLARALAAIETQAGTDALAMLLDAACADARAHVIGLTGPPGVGKSTLTNTLIARARANGETVGVIAVDPSSRRTGARSLATAPAWRPIRAIAASTCARWPHATGSAACPIRPSPPWC